MATLDTEIRKLQPAELFTLAQILNQSDSWKKLMSTVPNNDKNMFNNDHFIMIEQAVRQQQRSGAEIFLSEWSTLNKKRPTCQLLLDLLIKAELFRAADYVAVNILKGEPPERPKFGPAAAVDVSEKALEELLKQQVANLQIDSQVPEDSSMSWSMHFVEKPISTVAASALATDTVLSDLIKFSNDKSDLIKFSSNGMEENSINMQEPVTDLMKFSTQIDTNNLESENFVLQEARSEDIPLCVRENGLQSSSIVSTETENLETTSTSSSDTSHSRICSEQIDLPSVSQHIIPVVVLEYNEKDKNDA